MSSLDFETSSCRNINNNNTHGYASNNNNNISNSSLMQKPIPAPSSNAPAQLIQVSCSHVLESEPSASNAAKIPDTAALLALDSSEDSEYEPFISSNAPIRRGTRSSSSSSVLRSLKRNSCWGRIHGFLTRNWYLSCLVPASILGALIFIGWATRDYARQLLFWIEMQNAWIIFAVYMALFALVSFPVVVGYFVLLITAGYLFGCLRGWLIVILGANLGIAVAHATIRSCRHRIPVQRLIKNDTGRAILRVISGPKAFRVVLFTRLTPIPFGVQNVIFGISSINTRDYHVATVIGLLPAQTINVYLGSTLRSMHEVLNDNETKLTGYISFVFEVICGVVLMFWVLQKARKELSETLLIADYNNEGKHPDIQV
ncbi:transmembrane protein 64 isoform X1 [Drosophila eugracilis]|uniref:transmembrane protein 64 isoform X1 n=1 Tax=Drosophila eugracilis TaxID=29029 RepID=UPI0007E845DE|nr:transmembrane protein 64 isoform X1 [Drosophila eugracilis]XP_017084300.1 transmembrane protein 64 isoform X1 [Drosophila eugracilis]